VSVWVLVNRTLLALFVFMTAVTVSSVHKKMHHEARQEEEKGQELEQMCSMLYQ
jgi:large-conductance mechanosensitive channel